MKWPKAPSSLVRRAAEYSKRRENEGRFRSSNSCSTARRAVVNDMQPDVLPGAATIRAHVSKLAHENHLNPGRGTVFPIGLKIIHGDTLLRGVLDQPPDGIHRIGSAVSFIRRRIGEPGAPMAVQFFSDDPERGSRSFNERFHGDLLSK